MQPLPWEQQDAQQVSTPRPCPAAPVAAEENTEETTVSDTTVVESVTGAIESMEESQPEVPQSVRIYGPVTKMEDGRLSIDNQSGMSTSGEIIPECG